MNYVEVSGGLKSQRDAVGKTVGWFIRNHMSRFRTLDIQIQLKDCKKQGIEGCCLHLDGNEFELEIERNLTLYDLVCTVIHEMIHVKQYARKELVDVNAVQYWKGRNCQDVSYLEQPWEKEAYRLQDKYTIQLWKDNVL
jgi:hypothetical protein